MSRHEGVSCDSCLVGNFRGRRYKCLICYDYDLCPTCYEAGATSTRHTAEHPMQCILTRSDFDLYYGGEAISVEQPQSFTCPYCGKMGFTEVSLQEHVSSEHSDTSFEVVCPVCAALPGGDPNLVTDDFGAHLTLEHRSPRDLDEPSSSRHVRRIPHPGRGVGATRARRSNMHFSSSGGLASLSPSSRDSMDPIAELLSQLSGVRRSGASSQSTTTSQLQQLQMQLQLERQQAQVARQQLERLPRRQAQIAGTVGSGAVGAASGAAASSTGPVAVPTAVVVEISSSRAGAAAASQFLLARYAEPQFSQHELQQAETERADRGAFVCELLMNALVEGLASVDMTGPRVLAAVEVVKPPGCSEAGSGGSSGGAPVVASSTTQSVPAASTSRDSESPSSSSSSSATSATSTPAPSRVSGATAGGSGPAKSKSQQGSARTSGATSSRNAVAGVATTAGGGGGRGSSSTAQQQQQHHHQAPQPLQQQQPSRTASSGTGTMREMAPAPPQGVAGNGGRLPGRQGTSPSSATRRKMARHLDGRNQPNEPPPPH